MLQKTADELIKTVNETAEKLKSVDDKTASIKPAENKWSVKEIIGHLIDSAANNHQRFVRAQDTDELILPKYEQDLWVSSQKYNNGSWNETVDLWRLYNLHLAHVIKNINPEKLKVICKIGDYEPVTLGFIVEDYLVHLRHHLAQIEKRISF